MEDEAQASILEAAMELFNRRGYRSVTTDEIARKRGMSKRTLYQHFPSKEDLADSLVSAMLQRTRAKLDEAFASQSDFPSTFRAILRVVADAFSAFSPLFLEDLERFTPAVFARITAFREQRMRGLALLLRRAQAEGSVRAEVSPDVAVDFLIAAVQGIGRPEWMSKRGLTVADLTESVGRLFLYGVSGVPGTAGGGEIG